MYRRILSSSPGLTDWARYPSAHSHFDDLAKAGEGREGSHRTVALKVSYNVADGLCRSHSKQHVHVIDSRFHNEELILPGLTYFKNLALDNWCELFSENMLSVLGRPHQMEIEPVAGRSMNGFIPGRFHTAWESETPTAHAVGVQD